MKNFFPFLVLVVLAVISASAHAQSKKYAMHKIVIDAGHGGHDSGCRGKFSNEKDVALSVSLKFGKLVEERMPDVKVVYTRKTDVFVTLNDRADIANDNKADFFICIHCNAGSKVASGTETFVMGLHKTEDNLKVAQRENSSILMEDNYQSKYDNFNPNSPEAYIAISLRQNAFLDQSLSMAEKIERQFRTSGRDIRGVKQAGFWVLYRTTMPSILIETGFLTNPEEEKYLNSEKGQNELAQSIYSAFKEYREEAEGRIADDKTPVVKVLPPDPVQPESSDPNDTSKAITFAVQFATASEKRPLSLDKEPYSSLKDIETERTSDGTLKYSVGRTSDYAEVQKVQNELREKGFRSAFIIANKGKERISISQARSQQK